MFEWYWLVVSAVAGGSGGLLVAALLFAARG